MAEFSFRLRRADGSPHARRRYTGVSDSIRANAGCLPSAEGVGSEGASHGWPRVVAETVASPKVEIFYWVTITFSQTLGTALGDGMADDTGLGYAGGALVFGGALVIFGRPFIIGLASHASVLAAFILTRPLGATVGDFLDKPVNHGGSFRQQSGKPALVLLCLARDASAKVHGPKIKRSVPANACRLREKELRQQNFLSLTMPIFRLRDGRRALSRARWDLAPRRRERAKSVSPRVRSLRSPLPL